MTRNLYKVPKRAWKKFGPVGRRVFNRIYGGFKDSQSVMAPPAATLVPRQTWRVLCWNFAFMAALEAKEAHGEA